MGWRLVALGALVGVTAAFSVALRTDFTAKVLDSTLRSSLAPPPQDAPAGCAASEAAAALAKPARLAGALLEAGSGIFAWVIAVAVMGVALVVCCARMLSMQRQLQHAQLRAAAQHACGRACASFLGSERQDSYCSQVPSEVATPATIEPRNSEVGTSGEHGSDSPEDQRSSAEIPTPQTPEDAPAFSSPFSSSARKQPFPQSKSLSPRTSTGAFHASRRPPRVPSLTQRPSLVPSPRGTMPSRMSADSSASLDGSSACVCCTQCSAHGSLTPQGTATPALLTPYSSGNLGGLFEKQVPALPELMQLVAAYQASTSASAATTPRDASMDAAAPPPTRRLSSGTVTDHVLLSGESLGLPMRLAQSLVDPSDVEYLHGPDGKLDQLGAGASGKVYKALFNGEVIAAKEIDIGSSPEMRESFVTEVLLLQQLRHPNVVGFFGLSLTARRGVVLLEFCEGRDLHSALQLTAAGTSERLFGWHRRGRRVAYEVAKALNFLHSKGVTHCDIKSSNILLTASGEARLSDVGLARHQAIAASDARCMGTFAWMAPELLLDANCTCTPACDVYSYGVLLWEIITGERPLKGRLRAPKVPEECPQGVCDLAMRCMANNPAERPTAGQLLQELGLLLLKRAFAADRTTTNLLGTKSGGVSVVAAEAEPKRSSTDGTPLRALSMDPPATGMRRSISFNYPLLVAAGSSFNQATVADWGLAAVHPEPLGEP